MSNNSILRPLFGKHRRKKRFVAFDIETYGETNEFYMGGVYDEDGYKAFYDKDSLIKELLKRKNYKNTYIAATNLQFDFNGTFFRHKLWNEFKIIMRGSNYISCIHNTDKQTLKFIDTFSYAPYSLKVLGKIIGNEKGDAPEWLGERKPLTEEEKEHLERYNEQDCIVTYEFMQFFQDGIINLGGKLQLTAASCAMDIYRRKYLRKNLLKEDYILQLSKEETIHNFIFKSYYGGRTEVFERGTTNEDVYVYDINSLYPSVMAKEYPRPNSVRLLEKGTVENINSMGITHCWVKCPDDIKYPLLPVRHDNKLMFPRGVFQGVWCNNELQKAVALGYSVFDVKTQLVYKKSHFPFRNFVNDMYHLRLDYKSRGDPMEAVVKLMMNSLYGKFGQRRQTDVNIVHYKDIRPGWDVHEYDYQPVMDGEFFIGTKPKEAYLAFVIPIYASYTTAYARLKLYDYITEYDALYCDTDSVFTRRPMPESNELGEMKLEYVSKRSIFIKPKMYMLDIGEYDVVKLKGVSNKDKHTFKKLLRGEHVGYIKFSKIKESLRRNFLPNTRILVQKLISLEDNKRDWPNAFDPKVLQRSKPVKVYHGIEDETENIYQSKRI